MKTKSLKTLQMDFPTPEFSSPSFIELKFNPNHSLRKQLKQLNNSSTRTPTHARSDNPVDTSSRKKDSSNEPPPYCLLGTSIRKQSRPGLARDHAPNEQPSPLSPRNRELRSTRERKRQLFHLHVPKNDENASSVLTSDARKALTRSEKTLKKASRVLDKNLQPIVKQRHIVYRRPVHTSKFIDGTHNRYLKGKGD